MSDLKKFVLVNANGMQVELLNLGARIHSICLPVEGELKEMVVNYQDLSAYESDEFYLGATCGRVCNRIGQGLFELNGQSYSLPINDGVNCLHGGKVNFAHKYWQVEEYPADNRLEFSLRSEAMDQGFPGELLAKVSYQLTEANELKVLFSAKADKDTPVNLTNHAYFNLGEENCKDLLLQVHADHYLELDETQCPTGEMVSVADSEFDFRQPGEIRVGIDNPESSELVESEGYDHCYVFNKGLNGSPKATLTSEQNNIRMKLYSDQPGLQVYSGRWLDGVLNNYQGIALESQNFPDAVNKPQFPNSILKAGETYQHELVYQFETLS